MGHYRSEMMSDEECREEHRRSLARQRLREDGAAALREIFGERAEAVAFFLHSIFPVSSDIPEERVKDAFSKVPVDITKKPQARRKPSVGKKQ